MTAPRPPLILFSGMGADARVFAAQRAALPNLQVPEWIKPEQGESLAQYAGRFAERIDPGGPCFIGGASFGGFVALEMVRHLHPLACFLIGSVRSPKEFPGTFQALRKLSAVTAAVPFELASLLSKVALFSSGVDTREYAAALLSQLAESDAAFLRWACRAVLEWESPALDPAVPIYHIHGAKDFVLPVANTKPDVIVPAAGHALSLTHPQPVTAFLAEKMAAVISQR